MAHDKIDDLKEHTSIRLKEETSIDRVSYPKWLSSMSGTELLEETKEAVEELLPFCSPKAYERALLLVAELDKRLGRPVHRESRPLPPPRRHRG